MMKSSAGVPRVASGSASRAGGTWPWRPTSGRASTSRTGCEPRRAGPGRGRRAGRGRASNACSCGSFRGERLQVFVVEVERDFLIQWRLSFYNFLDSSSQEPQKSTPNHIDEYAAYETRG